MIIILTKLDSLLSVVHPAPPQLIMASAIASIAHAAHSVAASVLTHSQISPGVEIPTVKIKEDEPDASTPLSLIGKNILVSRPPLRAHSYARRPQSTTI